MELLSQWAYGSLAWEVSWLYTFPPVPDFSYILLFSSPPDFLDCLQVLQPPCRLCQQVGCYLCFTSVKRCPSSTAQRPYPEGSFCLVLLSLQLQPYPSALFVSLFLSQKDFRRPQGPHCCLCQTDPFSWPDSHKPSFPCLIKHLFCRDPLPWSWRPSWIKPIILSPKLPSGFISVTLP